MDKLRAIRFFCSVVDKRSFSAAAHDMDVRASVVSKALAALEDDLGFRLLHRTTRRISMTEAGARYYEHCKRLLTELYEAEVLSRDGLARPAGTLLAGLHPAVSRVVMPRLNEFLRKYPDIQLETTLVSTAGTLVEDRLDVLIAPGELPALSYSAQKLGNTRLVLVSTPDYLEKAGTPSDPEDLAQHQIILSGRRDVTHGRWTLTKGTITKTVFVRGRAVNREGVHMHEICMGGAGICRLFDISVRDCVQRGDLSIVLPRWEFPTVPVYALYASRKSVPAKVRAFVEFCRDVIRSPTRSISRTPAVRPRSR